MDLSLASDIMLVIYRETSIIYNLSTELLKLVLRRCVLPRPYWTVLLHYRQVIYSTTPKPTLYFLFDTSQCLTEGYSANLWQEAIPLLYQEI
jgi:hypothetical protein